MADYNIYIHSDGETASSDPTKPWGNSQSDNAERGSFVSTSQRAFNVAQNPDSLISSAIGTVAKAIPSVAVAYAAIKLTDKIATETLSIQSLSSGDQRALNNFNDFKSCFYASLRPISTSITMLKTSIQIENQNTRNALQRQLLGDSVLTGSDNYGV